MAHQSQPTKVITFGCRLNTYESEVIKSFTQGFDDTVVINTCAVTKEAERQARQAIRKLHRSNPEAKIVVTGCAAQINPKQFSDMPGVAKVLGNEEKMNAQSYITPDKIQVTDIMALKETAGHLISGFDGKARGFVQVQNGCNHRCTFCQIPYGRGNSRSIPVGAIVDQVRVLVTNGYQEIVLTGVDITDYGLDLPGQPRLGQLARRLLNLVPELKRLRLSSLDPVEVDDELWELIGTEKKLLPHLHISAQAGDDLTLKRMKRRHLRDDIVRFCLKARQLRPEIVFGADIIAGFPTETASMFQNTLSLAEDCDISFLHVFPYSAHPGTPAARMPQVATSVIKERAALLRQAGDKARNRLFSRMQGITTNCLVESKNEQYILGKTDEFAPIMVPITRPIHEGKVVKIKVTGAITQQLLGELV